MQQEVSCTVIQSSRSVAEGAKIKSRADQTIKGRYFHVIDRCGKENGKAKMASRDSNRRLIYNIIVMSGDGKVAR